MTQNHGQDTATGANFAENLVWLLFCAACAYLAFLQPYVALIPGERANVFPGFLCAITFAAALVVADLKPIRATKAEVAVSLGLLMLAIVSGLLSPVPSSSLIRALILMSSVLGGFWLARILLNSSARQKAFVWLCSTFLGGITGVSLWSYFIHGDVFYYLYSNPHQIIHMVLLLVMGPLVLISRRKPFGVLFGLVLIVSACATLFLIAIQHVESGILIPITALCVLAFLGLFRSKTSAGYIVLIFIAAALAAFFLIYLSPKYHGGFFFQSYRIESYPFSLHIAKKHPLFGIGLRAPRDEFLADYEFSHPGLTKELFAPLLQRGITPENIFLAFLAGIGAPFLILYVLALTFLLVWLIRGFLRGPPSGQFIPAWALLVPILGSLLHSFTTDTYMLAQLGWYFHLFLGLIPKPVAVPSESRVSWGRICVRMAGLVAALALGIFLGSGAYFIPEKLPTAETIRSYLRQMPVVKPFFYERGQVPLKTQKTASPHRSRLGGESLENIPDTAPREEFGTLVVNIDDYKGAPVNWAIMIILDNSKSMTEEIRPGGPTRRELAITTIDSLAREIGPKSKMSLRAFTFDGIAKKKSEEIPLRLSRIVLGWTEKPSSEMPDLLNRITFKGNNNLCAATFRSLRTDFRATPELAPRIAMITDGRRDCSFGKVIQIIEKAKSRNNIILDVIAIDAPRSAQSTYSNLAADSGGVFLNLAPSADSEALSRYWAVLRTPRPEPLEAVTENAKYRIMPGEKCTLAPGSYTITVPEFAGLDSSNRAIKDVKITAGGDTVLNLAAKEGRLIVRE